MSCSRLGRRCTDIPSLRGVPPEAETWIVPLAVADEIADLRVQLPIGVPFDDGRPSCGEHSFPARPGSIQWSWALRRPNPSAGISWRSPSWLAA